MTPQANTIPIQRLLALRSSNAGVVHGTDNSFALPFRIRVPWLIVFIHLFLVASAFSASFTITGQMVYETQGVAAPSDRKPTVRERSFEVYIDDCRWAIRIFLPETTDFQYFLSAFDGTNVVYVDKLTDARFAQLEKKMLSNRGTSQEKLFLSCVVEAGPVPRIMSSVANAFPWLAFASGCYFKGITNGLATDIYAVNEHASDFAARREVPCKVTLAAEPPYLPTAIEYWWTNRTKLTPEGKLQSEPLPSPFKDGFLAGRFKAEQFTNVNGLQFPMRFQMAAYRPLSSATTTNDFRAVAIVRGTVTSISHTVSVEARAQLKETLGAEMIANDFRFSTEAPISRYNISNGVIPAMSDPNVLAATKQAIRQLEILKALPDKKTVQSGEDEGAIKGWLKPLPKATAPPK